MAQLNWGEHYYDHYSHFFREPIEVRRFSPVDLGPRIQVLAYDTVFRNCRVFASLGLSHYAPELHCVAEVVLPVNDAWELVPSLLANALFELVQQRLQLGWGMAVCGLEKLSPDFVASCGKSALYFTKPFDLPDDFPIVACEGQVGQVLLAMFVSSAEYEYFHQHGAEQLEQLLESEGVDPYNLTRPSIV